MEPSYYKECNVHFEEIHFFQHQLKDFKAIRANFGAPLPELLILYTRRQNAIVGRTSDRPPTKVSTAD